MEPQDQNVKTEDLSESQTDLPAEEKADLPGSDPALPAEPDDALPDEPEKIKADEPEEIVPDEPEEIPEPWPVVCPPTTLEREYLYTAPVFFGVVILFIGTLVGQILLSLLVQSFGISYRENGIAFFLVSALPMYAVGMPLSLLVFRLRRPLPPERKQRIPLWAMLCVFCACISLSLVGGWIGNIVNSIYEFMSGRTSEVPVDVLTKDTPLWMNILMVVLAAPILEEIFYRKIIIDRLRRYGDLFAVFCSALIFGVVHANFQQSFYALFVGSILGWVYVHSGRLRYPIILHMSFNVLGTVSSEVVRLAGGSEAIAARGIEENPWWLILFILAEDLLYLLSFAGTILACVFLIRKLKPQKPTVSMTRSQKLLLLFWNPSAWILLALMILLWS